MREKCGVRWDRPAAWDWTQDGTGAGEIRERKENCADGKKKCADAKGAGADPAPLPAWTPPNRDENEFMMNLMILRNTLVSRGPKLRERCRRAGKWIWRDVRLMTRLVCTVQEALMETMPKSREEYYDTYRRAGHYELVINGPVRPTRYVLISDRKLAALTEAAMCSECTMCMRDGAEIGKCLLREALLEVAPPTEVEQGRWRKCEYRRAAGQLIREEEVRI